MCRILIAECKQEVSTFNPHPSDYEDFRVIPGEEMEAYYKCHNSEVSGALSVFDSNGAVEPEFAIAFSMERCGGTLEESAWERLSSEFLNAVEKAPKPDGIYFSMHGAMACESEFDPEGYLISKTREIWGESIPIVVSLDLHGIPTDRMFRGCDAIVAFHTYPHVDLFETGQRAAALLLDIVERRARPVTAKVAIPALVRGDELITETGKFGKAVRVAQAAESEPRGLSAGMFIGNPFTDVPELQSYAFVVADADFDFAEREALLMAQQFWTDRESLQADLTSVEDAMSILSSKRKGTIALVDAADATSSGASGDSNALLRAVIKNDYQGSVLLPLVDGPAVERAFALGVGGTGAFFLGGALDSGRFSPMRIKARVRMLSDGTFPSESSGETWNCGRSAVLQAGGITVVVTTKSAHLFDRSLFFAHGQDPRNFDAVVVKSPHCQRHMYEDWCERMINVDAPGSTSANLARLGHTKCIRPIFPLDEAVHFEPRVVRYERTPVRQ